MDQEKNRRQEWRRIVSGLVMVAGIFAATHVLASDERSLGEKIGETAKKVGTSIEQGVKKVVKKVEDKHVGDKVERKLKKAADKTAQGFEKAGKKIKQKLGD